MTDAELDDLQRLCEAAPPGPWLAHPGTGVIGWGDPSNPVEWFPLDDADADELMARSRTALPQLVAEVRRLRAAQSPSNAASSV